MIQVRPSDQRGSADHGWLKAKHSFSFGSYYDPENMGFGHLRVINQDVIAAGAGFPEHPHRDMEIITYITQGVIAHKDSMGNGLQIEAGEVQVMSAGTGVAHSEYNPDSKEPLKLLQIWIEPDRIGHQPRYEQKTFKDSDKKNQWRMIVSQDGREGSLKIHQNAQVYASILDLGKALEYAIKPERRAWLQIIRGRISLNGNVLGDGDAASVEHETLIKVEALENTEFLLFDLS